MSTFGLISYGTAGLAFIMLLSMLVTSWRGRATGRRLIVAVAVTAAWAAALAWRAQVPELSLRLVFTLEMLRDGGEHYKSSQAENKMFLCGLCGNFLIIPVFKGRKDQ